ncbi:MAG: NADH-quinone oxidoreductase subunit N [Nitrospinae bacterium]|nr:NADH-quinone oxidoreductase subunit N [Nitrospinota bacterium]
MPIVTPFIDLTAVAPEIVLSVFACLLLFASVCMKNHGAAANTWLAITGVIVAGWYAFCPVTAHSAFTGMYEADKFAQIFKIIILLGTGLTILISSKYSEDEKINHGEYYALLLFATVGMLLMVASSDMITLFLGLELLSICLYVLAGYTRTRAESNEAALKYFLLGGFAAGFLLYGMAMIYGSTGHTDLAGIGKAVSHGAFNKMYLTVGAIMLLVGLGFKLAAVPFHQWTPDVYQGSPIPITAFMSAGPKAAVLAALIRVYEGSVSYMHVDWLAWLGVLAVMTMTVGNVAALVQNDVKRMLAFSSISHAGYAMVGLAAANKQGIASVIIYMLVYTLMNIAAFGVLALVARKNEQRTKMQDFAGFAYSNPFLAIAMTILAFSLAGIPPMAGFMAKFYVFMSAMQAGLYWLVVAAVINSAIGIYYYLRFTVSMYMREPEEKLPPVTASPALLIAIVVSLIGVLVIGVVPADYLDMAGRAILSF